MTGRVRRYEKYTEMRSMDEFEATVMKYGRITIPAEIREKQGIEDGDIVLVRVEKIGKVVRVIEKKGDMNDDEKSE